jgi:hypothetical protein
MIKVFAAGTLGVTLMFGAIGPAAAGYRHGHVWIDQYPSADYSYSDRAPRHVGRAYQAQPNITLDRETESVWRNLRPEWFD